MRERVQWVEDHLMTDAQMHKWLCERGAVIGWGSKMQYQVVEIRFRKNGKIYGEMFTFNGAADINRFVTAFSRDVP